MPVKIVNYNTNNNQDTGHNSNTESSYSFSSFDPHLESPEEIAIKLKEKAIIIFLILIPFFVYLKVLKPAVRIWRHWKILNH